MALDLAVFARDLGYVIADMPATLVWDGQTITCMKSEGSKTHDLNMDGPMPMFAETVQAKAADFTDSVLPEIGVRVTLDDVAYRIARREISPCGVQATLELEDVNQ